MGNAKLIKYIFVSCGQLGHENFRLRDSAQNLVNDLPGSKYVVIGANRIQTCLFYRWSKNLLVVIPMRFREGLHDEARVPLLYGDLGS